MKGENLLGPLIELIMENNVDILALVESENLDCQVLLNSLYGKGEEWKLVEIAPLGDMKVFSKKSIAIKPYKEEKRYAIYQIHENEKKYLLTVVHLSSAMHLEENARNKKAEIISNSLKKIEADFYYKEEFKSIIVGDFNLQPYSEGIIGVYGFNATKSKEKALQIKRTIDGENHYFYFNPIWKLMGENKMVQGTYYNSSDQQLKSIYWYSFDEVLIRPYFIDKFNWDYFDIVEKTKSYNFLSHSTIDKINYSDHLALKFEIMEG